MKKYTKIHFAWLFLLGLTFAFRQDAYSQCDSPKIIFNAIPTIEAPNSSGDSVKIKFSFSDPDTLRADSVTFTFSFKPNSTNNACHLSRIIVNVSCRSNYSWTPSAALGENPGTFTVTFDGTGTGTPCGLSSGSLVVVLTEQFPMGQGLKSVTLQSVSFYRNGILVSRQMQQLDQKSK